MAASNASALVPIRPATTMITATAHSNQVETEIVKLINQQPDKILYIDEASEVMSEHSHQMNVSVHARKNRSQSHFEVKPYKAQKKKKSYLDFTDDDHDDEISLTDTKEFLAKGRISSSFSADGIDRAVRKGLLLSYLLHGEFSAVFISVGSSHVFFINEENWFTQLLKGLCLLHNFI